MCRQPIRIKNNSKYINTKNGHQYYIWINCGHCDECVKAKQNEWTTRCYFECKKQLEQGKWIYFDTLTYRNQDLPRITNFIKANENYSCFNYKHIRQFIENLRQKLKLNKDNELGYFITTEYGDIRHRPHIHIMLFVPGRYKPLEFSKIIGDIWKYGRTDGIPYKSKQYVLKHNTITKLNIDCIRYISKYVNKSQLFMDIINKRWKKLEKFYEISKFNKLEIKKIRKQYYRLTTPFHRQNQRFGISAIENRDINEIIKNPIIWYKTGTLEVNRKIRLPMYYQRKLFQEQIKYNGKRIWVNNENGIKFKQTQEKENIIRIKDRLKDAKTNNNIEIDDKKIEELAIYIYFERGRLPGINDYKPHHKEAEYFNYNTDKDLKYLGKKCISKNFAGNDIAGYCTTEIEPTDIENKIYTNNVKEAILATLIKSKDTTNLVKLKEHMNEIKKIFF